MGEATQRVQRFESAALDRFEKTGSGGLRIPAFLSRIGVQEYRDADGNVVRELRHPDDVFAAEAVESFDDVPVTDLHPPELVTPANWRTYAVGAARKPRVEGQRVAADVIVTDGEQIRLIESGDRAEVSAGYTCDLVRESGEWNGQPYDMRQTNIRANHVALGPRGWGRAGPDVALRLDSAGNQITGAPRPARVERSDSMSDKRTVKVDGISYEAGSDSHLQAVEKLLERKDGELKALKADHDTIVGKVRGELEETKGRLDEAKAQLDDLGKKLEAEKKRADAASSDEEIDKRIESRLAVIDRARRVLGSDYAHAGKSDRDVMCDALKKLGRSISDEASDEYLKGAFDAATEEMGGDEDEEEETTDAGEGAGASGDDEEERGDSKRRDSKETRRDGVRPVRGGDAPVAELDRIRRDNADFHSPEKARSRWAVSVGR